jgi:hypothetical protein
MPEVSELTGTDAEDLEPEQINLHMPSSLPVHVITPTSLADKERRLRHAQAEDALIKLKQLLRVRFGLRDFKYTQVGHSQKANTRMRTLLTRFQEKISRTAECYEAARLALQRLDPEGSWTKTLLDLRTKDIKGPGREQDDGSEGRRELSWIWTVKGMSDDGAMPDEDELDKSKWLNIMRATVSWNSIVDSIAGRMGSDSS